MALCIRHGESVLGEEPESDILILLGKAAALAGSELVDMVTGAVLATADASGWHLTAAGLAFEAKRSEGTLA